MRRLVLLAAAALLAALPANLQAQAREVTGKVTVTGTGAPLPDATISVFGQQMGVRSNDKGEYKIRVPAGDVTLLARAIGYKRVSVRVAAGSSTADFALEKDVLQLEGVVVTGQATTVDKRNASTAIASVTAEELVRTPAKSLEGNLAGKVTGASVFENSGTPGGGAQIQIRGVTSVLGQGDPLYVIDGIIISNAAVTGSQNSITRAGGGVGGAQDQLVNRLADINPNDIESIEVLKSAAASAIYGSRATNGVVVITTKRGKAGTTRFGITQRYGQSKATRLLGSRAFQSYADVAPYLGGNATADSIAKANCTPKCKYYDWQGQLYNKTDPAFETVLTASGGANNTRFFASVNDKQNPGTQFNTGARRTSARLNLDQTIGEKLTVSAGLDVTHNFVQNGLGNNDNSGTSPIYTFGYAPAIYDIATKDATGHYPRMYMNGGGAGTSNPFEVLNNMTNNEDVWRQTANVRIGYSLLATSKNSIQLTYLGGVDRFQQENFSYAPNFLQFESADGFLGTSAQANTSNFQFNHGVNVIWTFTPGWKWFNSAQTAVGGSYETLVQNSYRIRARGLLPARQVAAGATDFLIENGKTEFRDQSMYLNEQILLLDEKLSIAAGVRSDRSSANGDRKKFYSFPKVSASYRWTKPFGFITGQIDELKIRAARGQSGNRPRYGDRDILIASGGVIGGQPSLAAATALGNTAIKPETMTEDEIGLDASFWGSRISFEYSHYSRRIKDLLLTFPLPASSGLASQVINGGQLSVNGNEGALTVIPIRTRDLEWTVRASYQQNRQRTDFIPVPAFNAPNSFGASYGRNRIAANTISTMIWGNAPLRGCTAGAGPIGTPGAGCSVADTILADANPTHQSTLTNTVTWKDWSFSALLDWRNGGYTSTMTQNLFDEGGNSRDFDNPSGNTANPKLGDFRYNTWAAGDIRPYVTSGTYVKLREVTVTYAAPKRWAETLKARDLRFSLSGRNLAMWTKYWSFDPEFSNFGNQNFNRFIDLAPYPPNRQFFFSIDLGY